MEGGVLGFLNFYLFFFILFLNFFIFSIYIYVHFQSFFSYSRQGYKLKLKMQKEAK